MEIREFDTTTKAFVPGGFHFDNGKQDVAWLDADTLLVSRDWGPGTTTQSGYPFIVKIVKRGQALDQAGAVFIAARPRMCAHRAGCSATRTARSRSC